MIGLKMANSYKIPKDPIKPGYLSKVEMQIIESMPVKSIITNPKNGDDKNK